MSGAFSVTGLLGNFLLENSLKGPFFKNGKSLLPHFASCRFYGEKERRE